MALARSLRLALLGGAICATPIFAQGPTGSVRGRVIDAATQEPLSAVSITVGTRAAITQNDGRYLVEGVPAGTHTLRARVIGYGPAAQQINVVANQMLEINLALTAQAVSLSEIVVTGYGEQRAGDVTGAVSQVGEEEFNTGRVISPAMLIQNKVPGVQVVDNNEPGGGLSVRIRGTTSVNASNEPLYVIDGMPVGNFAGGGLSAGRDPLNSINPDDIESITVLRDASAAAIYGANAANGVVLIQTKGGRGRPQFEYSASTSLSRITRRPDMLNAAEFRQAVTTYAPQNVPQLGTASTDWYDLVSQSGIGQEHNLAVAGATSGMNWRLSGGYLNQEGVIRGTTAQRISLSLNLSQRLFNDRLEVRTSLKGSRNHDEFTPGGVLSNAAQMGPTQPTMDPTSATGFAEWPGNQLTSADNPLAILALALDEGTTYRSIGNIQATYRLPWIAGLRASVNMGYDVTRADRRSFFPSILHSQTRTGTGGSDYRSNQIQNNTTFETFLNYGAPLRFAPGTIDLTGGYAYAQSHAEYPWFLATGLSTDLLGGNGVTSARTIQNFQDVQESKLISFFGRANWNYEDRYLAGVSIRRDGSSRFGEGNAWGTFPAVSVGWRLSRESMFRNMTNLSELKLRGSWARTGNQAFGNYQQYSAYVIGDAQTQVQWGTQFIPTIRPSSVDPNIKWEATSSVDIGLDIAFWNHRLSATIDWYNKNTSDMIFTVPVCAGCNLSNFVTTNIGSMRNRGFEIGLSARIREGRQGRFGWTADFTASHNSNELTSINPNAGSTQVLTGLVAGGVGTYIQVLTPGQPVNSFFVYRHRRGPDGMPLFADVDGDNTVEDWEIYDNINGDTTDAGVPIINQDDRIPFESPQPKWILGHSSYFTMNRWEMSFTMRAYLGNYVYNNVASNLGTYAEVGRGSPYNLHRSVLETGFTSPQYLSDYYVEDASFLRMDNITVAYNLTWRGQPLRLFGTVQNAFTMTGYSGVDPTAGLNGLDNNIYPRSRTFTAGLSARF